LACNGVMKSVIYTLKKEYRPRIFENWAIRKYLCLWRSNRSVQKIT